jgi:hypothetical protein
MTNKNADVVEPSSGVEEVIIEWSILCELFCELVQARLMAVFVWRVCFGANVFGDRVAVANL